MFQANRLRKLNNSPRTKGPIIYWMSRDQRVQDNWALIAAQEIAINDNQPLAVIFCLQPSFLGATLRHYDFMLKGLAELENELSKYKIHFELMLGDPQDVIPKYVDNNQASCVVTDFSPLRIGRQWREELAEKLPIPLYEVDAHNIIPCWLASDKQEFAARTFRPKVAKLLEEYLVDFPKLQTHHLPWGKEKVGINWEKLRADLILDETVHPVSWVVPGEAAAHEVLIDFLEKKLLHYADQRNDPSRDALSNLSPYLHFGQISAQRVALSLRNKRDVNAEAFLEELIVRRELSDNYCYYNPKYDQVSGFPAWSQRTLAKHKQDKREYTYTLEQFEAGHTHDPAWNAAQLEMVSTGKMHGYMRMYWGKKILEWSDSPEAALQTALYLNDKYELDGRDPNGYVGCAWAIGGVHDRPWPERPIYGTIRYMNAAGLKRKFNLAKYIEAAKSSKFSGAEVD
ncbi:MAG: deoxyribodipyrimidine photo-lyase [Candidatus Doudnabacteria bacterium]|nr:deoxyribodipyrimidine photo-lyase [Candidatus Doudnabacteria bacterium]